MIIDDEVLQMSKVIVDGSTSGKDRKAAVGRIIKGFIWELHQERICEDSCINTISSGIIGLLNGNSRCCFDWLTKVNIFTDCLPLVTQVSLIHLANIDVRSFLEDIIALMSKFQLVYIIQVPRHEVEEAHVLLLHMLGLSDVMV